VPSLRTKANPQEALLFQLVGVGEADRQYAEYGMILGKSEVPGEFPADMLYVTLPDPDNPLMENDRLAELLGRAVGLGKVHL
jgi:hypothetical protein